MKILMLTPYLPLPLDSGGQIRSYNLIKHLAQKHEITLYSLIKYDSEKKHIKELEKLCKKVRVFKRPEKPWTLRNILLTAGPFPFLVIRNLAPKQRIALRKEIETGEYDLIHAETFYVMPHIPKTKTPIILVEQTIEYLVYKHYVEEQAPKFLRPLLMIDVAKLRFWESYFWKKASRAVAVSDADEKQMRKLVPGLGIDVVPNGVDFDHFSAGTRSEVTPKRVLFVGNFTWLQNKEALMRLAHRVWPLIKKEAQNVKLWIVGRNMTPEIKRLAGPDVIIEENAPVIRDVFNQASVQVAPIEGPGGTRLKIFEAMATGLPTVTTPVGAAGLDLRDGVQVFIRSTDKGLASAVVKILKGKINARKMGDEARKFVEKDYTWKSSAEKLDEIYKKIVNAK